MYKTFGSIGAFLLACGVGTLLAPKADIGTILMCTIGALLLGLVIGAKADNG